MRRPVGFVTILVLVLLWAPPASAGAVVESFQSEETWDFTFQPDCFDEEIRVNGRVLINYTLVLDGSDGWHLSTTWRATGMSATGLTSGDRYRVIIASTGGGTDGGYYSNEGLHIFRSSSTYRILSPAGGPTLLSTLTAHQTFTPDGGLVVDRFETSWTCS